MTLAEGNVALAFALVIGAGAATGIGAAVVYFPSLIRLASTKVLASCLGVSAGVMLYVSFVEILGKSRIGFEDAGVGEANAYLYSTLSFFAGIVLMLLIDKLVHYLDNVNNPTVDTAKSGENGSSQIAAANAKEEKQRMKEMKKEQKKDSSCSGHGHTGHNIPIEEIADWHRRADAELKRPKTKTDAGKESALSLQESTTTTATLGGEADVDEEMGASNNNMRRHDPDEEAASKIAALFANGGRDGDTLSISSSSSISSADAADNERKLVRMGLNTALAIGIHNFPEGLATFVGAMDDPAVGVTLAIAIAIHNVPEGLCVAIPIFYATGDRKKAFMWAMLSGITEPIGALFGWLILANAMDDTMYGILFGVVGGMMVTICLHELLPTAHRYDKNDEVVTLSCIAGMGIMALSLCLFLYT
jgi:ZIP family zinc transporter